LVIKSIRLPPYSPNFIATFEAAAVVVVVVAYMREMCTSAVTVVNRQTEVTSRALALRTQLH